MMLPFQLPGFAQRGDAGEQMINSVVQAAIRALLSRVDDLKVSIHCQPVSKLLQGAIDSFQFQGKGLVIKNQFRAESMRVETDAITIDLGAILGGKVRLLRPLDAVASVVLCEADINAAFDAPLVVSKMRGITLDGEGSETLAFEQTRIALLENNAIGCRSVILFEPSGQRSEVAFKARLGVEEQRRIVLEEPACDEGGDERLMHLFITQFNRIMDIDRFNLDGSTLRIHRLRIRDGRLIFEGRARVERFPEPKKP